jgi:GNAT superfamily N-acetyltransferase
VHHWIAWVADQEAGLISLRSLPHREVEIDTFGLVPEYVGRGFGGHLLSMAVRLAWDLETSGAGPVRRVWLHTSSLDHPHRAAELPKSGLPPVLDHQPHARYPATSDTVQQT